MNQKEVKNVLLAGFLVAVLPVLAACTMPTDIPDVSLKESGPVVTESADATSVPVKTGASKTDIAPTPRETSASLSLNSAIPDLVITSGSPVWTPSAVAAGQEVILEGGFTVKNQGDTDAGTFYNGIYLSPDPVITRDDIRLNETGSGTANSELAAGTEHVWGPPRYPEFMVIKQTIPVETPPGRYYLGIMVDETGLVAESDETNNYVSSLIEVLPPPTAELRFAPWEPVVTPSAVYSGGEVTLADFMFEASFNEDSARPSIGFYLSEDTLITQDDTLLHMEVLYGSALHRAGIHPDQTLKIPTGIPAGTYYIGVLLDPENTVAESNEDNNSAFTPIKVMAPLPDLIITPDSPVVIGFPAEITPGGRVSLSLDQKSGLG